MIHERIEKKDGLVIGIIPCDCHDEQHKENANHRHTGDECIHEDGTRHTLHQR